MQRFALYNAVKGFSELYLLHVCAIKQGVQRMVIKQIRNAVQRGLTYIPDQCPLLKDKCTDWFSAI